MEPSIDETRKAVSAACEAIYQLLHRFEQDYGCAVTAVDIVRYDTNIVGRCSPQYRITGVKLRVEL